MLLLAAVNAVLVVASHVVDVGLLVFAWTDFLEENETMRIRESWKHTVIETD
jgi:hypothetical protein